MNLGRIGILTLPLALASCKGFLGDLDSDPDEPEINVTAAFSATPVSGTAPLVVQFTDESVGDVGGWDWRFGDGEITSGVFSSATQAHTYENPGTYTVTLHVISCTSAVNCRNSWETKTDLITVTAASVASTSSTPRVPSESAPPDSFLAGPDPAAETVALTETATPTGDDRIAGARLSPSLSPPTRWAVLELVTRCISGGPAHAGSLEGVEVNLQVGAKTYSLSPVSSFLGTTAREESPCTGSARYLLVLPGDAWPPSDACLVVRVAAGLELPRIPQRDGESDLAMVPTGAAFELIAYFDGITMTVLRGMLDAPAVSLPCPRAGRGRASSRSGRRG